MENSMQGEKLIARAIAMEILSSAVKLPPLPVKHHPPLPAVPQG